MLRKLLVPLALALVAAGCAGSPDSSSADSGSVQGLVATAGRNLHVDYDPLGSPADAVRKADLIATGTLVGVVDGITIEYADPAMTERGAGTYATFVVQVDKVLAGRSTEKRIYLAVRKNTEAGIRDLAQLNPEAKVVLVLDDITNWTPHPTAKVERPAAVPAGAHLYAPYNDGIWLQGPKDTHMRGITTDLSELDSPWGSPRTVSQFADRISTAAQGG
jgi:hypothetical protein